MIYDNIKNDLILATRNRDILKLSTLKVLLGEIQRKPDKDYNDEHVVSVIQKYLKNLKELNSADVKNEEDVLLKYLPNKTSKEDVFNYLSKLNIKEFNNKLVGDIIKYFPKGSITGKDAQNIVIEYFKNKK